MSAAGTFFKWTGILVLAIIGALAVVVWNNQEEQKKRTAEKDAVFLSAGFADECSGDRPIRVAVDNQSSQVVKSIRFQISVFERGHSDDRNVSGSASWTRIVREHKSAYECWPAPRVDGTIQHPVIHGDVLYLDFFQPNERIP